ACRSNLRACRKRVRARIETEYLELRSLLSTAGSTLPASLQGITASPAVELGAKPLATNWIARGYSPAQIRAAYGFNSIKGDGTGETIAIVDAFNAPTLAMDLAGFDHHWGLPIASLTQVNQTGGNALPQTDSGWALETSLDVEWAHAMAPGAKI